MTWNLVPENNSPLSSSFSALALELQQDADDNDNKKYTAGLGQVVEVGNDISGPSESSKRRQIRCFFGQKRMFCIRDMFNWSVEVGWDESWFQGVKNIESEALFYELMSRLPEDEEMGVIKHGKRWTSCVTSLQGLVLVDRRVIVQHRLT